MHTNENDQNKKIVNFSQKIKSTKPSEYMEEHGGN